MDPLTIPWQVIVWFVLFLFAVFFQLRSWKFGDEWGMLTSSMKWLRVRLWGRMIVFPFFVWLTWHWFMAPPRFDETWGDDAMALVVGVVLALFFDYEDMVTTKEEEEL